jgi:hypothetical protein
MREKCRTPQQYIIEGSECIKKSILTEKLEKKISKITRL